MTSFIKSMPLLKMFMGKAWLIAIILSFSFQGVFSTLSVHPAVLFLDEDWPPGRPLDVQICNARGNAQEDPLDLRILSGNEWKHETQDELLLPPFSIVPLNGSCAGLTLNGHLDADNVNIPSLGTELQHQQKSESSSTSFSLLLEDMNTHERATLQIELVDVNDNAPRFLGGPFPLELVITKDSTPGFLLHRFEVFDPDHGIGGIVRFALESINKAQQQFFALESPLCEWPKCSVELRLRQAMAQGERAELKVYARDGAGQTQKKRVNEAEVNVHILVVSDEERTEEEFEGNLDKSTGNLLANGEEMLEEYLFRNKTVEMPPAGISDQTSTLAPHFSASLITFDKKHSTKFPKLITANNQRRRLQTTTSAGSTTIAPISTSATTLRFPPATTFLIDPLDENAPIGIELLRIPIVGNGQDTDGQGGFQLVQLDGSNSLRMFPNGSVQLAQPLNAREVQELRAEVRYGGNMTVAFLRARIRPMVEQFSEWMDKAIPQNGYTIHLAQSELSASGKQIRILWLPSTLAKYAQLQNPAESSWKLDGRELLLTNFTPGQQHCTNLEFVFRDERLARRVCAEVPEREVPIVVHWPKNNSHHAFIENEHYPVLLALNVTGPSVMTFMIDNCFEDGFSFSITPSTGQLSFRASSSFDFEQRSQYTLVILVCPKAQTEESTKCQRIVLYVEVIDVNDHCPRFEQQDEIEERFEISEGTQPDPEKPIGQFKPANDGDGSADQRSICYRLDDSIGGIFGVQAKERPEIYLLTALDRELKAAYQLRVIAEDCPWIDSKCPSEAAVNNSIQISILVQDINDNPPRFTRRHFFAALIQRNVQQGEAMLQLKADDPDIDDVGRLHFAWGEGMVQTEGEPLPISASPFRLNRSSGEISLRHDFVPADIEKASSYTFRVRVRDPKVGHEDQISVLDATKHLLQFSFARDAGQLETQLCHIERLISSIVSGQGWQAFGHRLIQCGSGNCSELATYFLDKVFRPVEAQIAAEALSSNVVERSDQMKELRAKFGIVGFGQVMVDMSHLSPPVGKHAGAFVLVRRLFSLSPIGLVAAMLLAILSLACPFFTCRLLCRRLRKFRLARRQKFGSFGRNGFSLGIGQMEQQQFGTVAVRLMVDGGPRIVANKAGMDGTVVGENAYVVSAEQQKRLRWQTDSEEFEFPAPPPVRMYGNEGTLSIPRVKTVGPASSTEF